MRFHKIDRWTSPATAYPRASEGAWRIEDRVQRAGLHPMQTPEAYCYTPEPITLTVLYQDKRVWFTDEPRQCYALAEIGLFRARGRVIVGGLGLGLIHHYLRQNPMVEEVITIERAPELERLVWPHCRFGQLIVGDFYEVLPRLAGGGVRADTIITDFIFGFQNETTWQQLLDQRAFCAEHYPDAQLLEHGWQHRMDAEATRHDLGRLAEKPGLLEIEA